MRKPNYYRTPLRKREDIVYWIFEVTHQRMYHYHTYPFCFNVKLYDVDLSFDNLLKIFREEEGNPIFTHNADWLREVKSRYKETDNDHLWDWGVEIARDDFVSYVFKTPINDTYTQLWDGTPIDVQYSFQGRNGGWLSIDRFEGREFVGLYSKGSLREEMKSPDYPYQTLRNLYQLIVMIKHDIQGRDKHVERHASFAFFENTCSDIPRPDAIQLELPLGA